jgi:hypothetical protein
MSRIAVRVRVARELRSRKQTRLLDRRRGQFRCLQTAGLRRDSEDGMLLRRELMRRRPHEANLMRAEQLSESASLASLVIWPFGLLLAEQERVPSLLT